MTAPAIPHMYAMQSGGKIRLAWKPVDNATDYNIYMDITPVPTALEDSVNDSEAESDGAFVWWSPDEAGPLFVRITALNAMAEESDYSNERNFRVDIDSDNTPTKALRHIMGT